MFELFGVVLLLIVKWFLSSPCPAYRRAGFVCTVLVEVYWAVLFAVVGFKILAAYKLAAAMLALRGVRSNPMEEIK